jgi:DNA-binding NarL/FixJ family response regulator
MTSHTSSSDGAAAAAHGTRDGQPETSKAALRAVIADDHPLVARSLTAILESAGHRVVGTASDASKAVDCCRSLRPDILLADLRMPAGGGLAAARQLAQDMPKLPVVIISADSDPAHVREVLDAGCLGFITKMATEDEIVAVVVSAAAGELSLDRRTATAMVAADRHSASARSAWGLTDREVEVLSALAEGLSNPAIAAKLNLSRSTVAGIVSAIFTKLGVADRTAAAVAAWKAGMFNTP